MLPNSMQNSYPEELRNPGHIAHHYLFEISRNQALIKIVQT